MAFARLCAQDAHVMSVDLPRGAFGGGYPLWKVPLYKSFAQATQRLDLIRADSHSSDTFADVETRLDGELLDFLFIDGDHTYDGVKQDFERYKALVRRGGLIAFHDIAPAHAGSAVIDDPGEVPRFWAELREQREAREFIDPNGAGCFGIGVVLA
jgi:predicted O-methyltransferase YrrM